jgi:large subunit ribosomal protein L24
MKIKTGDNVLVIKGRDRGKKGKVLKVFPDEERVQIEGVNIRKKHAKPKRGGQKGQTVELFQPLSVSSCQLLCPKCGKPARIGMRVAGDKKFRICKRCKSEI